VGFVGAGYIARRHVETLNAFEDVSVVGIADPAVERAQELAALADGARAHPSMDDLIDSGDIDALYICVPPFAHGAPEERALERGLPFFVEKPLALDVATARRIAEGVGATGLTTAVGYHWRYLDAVTRARDLLGDRQPRLVLAHWLSSTPGAAWWTRSERSGGQLLEQATHLVDLARYLVGEVVGVHAWGSALPREAFPDSDIFDASVAALQFERGAVGMVASTCVLNASHRVGLQVIAEGLSVEVRARGPGGGGPFDLVVDRGDGASVEADVSDPFMLENRDFIDAVRGKEDRVRAPYVEALRSHEVAGVAVTALERGASGAVP